MALYVEQHWGNTAKARRKREQNFATHSHLGNGNVETERYKKKPQWKKLKSPSRAL